MHKTTYEKKKAVIYLRLAHGKKPSANSEEIVAKYINQNWKLKKKLDP